MGSLVGQADTSGFLSLGTNEFGVTKSVKVTEDGSQIIKIEQDLGSFFDEAHAQREHNDGYSPSRELRRVATIPAVLRLHLINNEGWDPLDPECQDRLVRLLNDSDYAKIRTAYGVLAISNGEMR